MQSIVFLTESSDGLCFIISGDKASDFFIFLVCGYVEVYIDELLGNVKTYTIKVYVKKEFKLSKKELKTLISFAYGDIAGLDIKPTINRLRKEFGNGYIHSNTISDFNDQLDGHAYCFSPENIKF